ncbi:MAG: hypothetical protein M9962_15540 [Oligoflexia bacterium]|nr:hypothetical protein [Oligoflexia bacterium]
MEQPSVKFKKFRMGSGVSFFSTSQVGYSWKLLIFLILLIYVPFLGDRVIRSAGDDKVYVSQAIEMAQNGHWFLQTMGGEPNYYKGPLHYILLRIGMGIFGFSMWATVYMNLILVILGSLALGAIVHRHMKDYDGWSFFVAFAFALNAGIFSHVFASQMEVETAALYAIGIYFLDRAGPGKADIKFWIVAGLIGWLKSPLHSVLLGVTALLFWTWNRELLARIKAPSAWGAALLGVLICVLGYAPAFILDRENFINTYILRETLHKPANGAPWHYPIIPLFTYSLFPWTLPAIIAYWDSISRFWRKQRVTRVTAGAKRVMALGLVMVIPSVLFFIWHPYRGQNYNLPVIGGLILYVCAVWASRADRWNRAYSLSLVLTAFLVMIVPVLLTFVAKRFDPMPFWWPSWLLPVVWIGCLFSFRGLWKEGFTFSMIRPASLARRTMWIFIAMGAISSVLGEREMVDVRDQIYQAKKENQELKITYYNLQKNIWSEWGYLNFMIPHPVKGLFTQDDLVDAVNSSSLIIVPGDHWLEEMKNQLNPIFPNAKWEIEPWRRWKTKGKNAQGVPAWKDAWNTRDLNKVEKRFYMVRVSPEQAK